MVDLITLSPIASIAGRTATLQPDLTVLVFVSARISISKGGPCTAGRMGPQHMLPCGLRFGCPTIEPPPDRGVCRIL
jgi:hypothetical protein